MKARSAKIDDVSAHDEIDLRIIGVPRSGTNFVKFLLETGAGLRCRFNAGWWKHAVIPPLLNGRQARPEPIPTVVLHREPLRQMVSFYRFSCKGRTAISGNHESLSAFLRSPIVMKPNGQLELWFPSPVAYWIQFYRAALAWRAPRILVDPDAARSCPTALGEKLSQLMGRQISIDANDPKLSLYMGRNPDVPVGPDWSFEDDTTLEAEDQATMMILESMSDHDRGFILSEDVQALRARLISLE